MAQATSVAEYVSSSLRHSDRSIITQRKGVNDINARLDKLLFIGTEVWLL
jgi:hypothetical protein